MCAIKVSKEAGKNKNLGRLNPALHHLSQEEIQTEKARRTLSGFAEMNRPGFCPGGFHEQYYRILDRFARGEINKLIVTIPPQHGKSQGSTVLLPAYLLGKNPDLRIVVASYSLSLAARFNRQIQRVIDSQKYREVFPNTRLKKPGSRESYIRTGEEFEVIGHTGGVLAVGREGALTGNPVDVMIIDDLYKDALEGNSPVVREHAWEWYVSVVKTRLHNQSRELIVMTRWHEDDLIGRLCRKEGVITVHRPEDFRQTGDPAPWYHLNFEAIKEGEPSELDRRQKGEALWPERHDQKLLYEKRDLDPVTFQCMYQGKPAGKEGLLYGDSFKTYRRLPEHTLRKANYTDTADTGEDYLCSVCYETDKDGLIFITDIVYTPLSMEFTEEAVGAMFSRNETRIAAIESNNGGRGFARNVAKLCRLTKIEGFTQSGNKESRILTNSATVLKYIVMPVDWQVRWPEFYRHVTGYRRLFKSNRLHDAADVLTGIVEREVVHPSDKRLKCVRFSVK